MGRLAIFARGGVWAILIIGGLGLVASATGGHLSANFGGLLLIFGAGGLVALLVEAIYWRGRRDAKRKEQV